MATQIPSFPDYAGFTKAVMKDWNKWEGLDAEELFDLAMKHNVLRKVPGGYNPALHGEAECGEEPGDDWYEPNWEMAPRVRMADLLRRTAERHKLAASELKGNARIREIAWPRQEFMWLARQHGYSYPMIGRYLGLDHSTVIYGERAFQSRLDAGLATID